MRLAAAALALVLARGAVAADLTYLHIEANEGGSSGGHVALRQGDTVFHYQHEAPGVLRLERDSPARFDQRYRLLENRTIHATHVTVDDDTAARLRDELTRRHLVGTQHRACRAALDADVRLLALMDGEPGALRVAGAGFFADGGDAEPALVALRARVGDVSRREAAVRAQLVALGPDAFVPPPLPSDALGPPCYGFAQRYEDGVALLLAFDALAAARPLASDAVRTTGLALRDDERAVVAAHRDAITERVARLVDSRRPGAGFALLVGMARLAALQRTLDTGHWVLLDAYAADAAVVDPAVVQSRRDAMDDLVATVRRELDVARTAFVTAGTQETALGDVETAGNRLVELLAARDDGRPLRIQTGALLPQRPADVRALPAVPNDVAPALATARARADAYTAAVTTLDRYELVTRNCVTELFAAVDAALGSAAEAERRLGGHVDGTLRFIPFVAAASVADTWTVDAVEERPSYRRMRLATMPGVLDRLRESNTVTSTIYRRNPDDSVFLFFTDDGIAMRPLLGLANLAVGLGAGIAGLGLLPADGGALLRAGVWGAIWSVPELVFVNIRKGTFAVTQESGTSNTSTSAADRATSAIADSSSTAAPSPASSTRSPS